MNELFSHSGAWGLALIMIVVASWFFYRLYALLRHPQYLGLFMALFGEGIVHWPTIFSVALFPIIVLAYSLLARKEERRMVEQFGEQYLTYQRRVPMFIPRWGQWRNVMTMRSSPAAKKSLNPRL
jgi:steroid 5-alpha reductase family enzyme